MSRHIWVDKKGNTCIGIKPEEKPKKETIIEEVTEDDNKKTTKSSRGKRSRGKL